MERRVPRSMPTTTPFWSTLYTYVHPFRAQLAVTVVCSLLVGIAVALQPLTVKFIVDQGINRPDASAGEKARWALLFVAIYLLLSAFRIGVWMIGYRRLVRALEGFLFSIRCRFFRHVQGMCFRFHDDVSSGELFNYIMGSPVVSLRVFLEQFAQNVPYQAVSGVVAVTTLAFFDWQLTLVLVLVALGVIAVSRRSERTMKGLTRQFMETESSVSRYIADMLRGSREIKIQALEDRVSDDFAAQVDRIRRQGQHMMIRGNVEYVKPEAIEYVGMAVIYALGALACIDGRLTVGEFFAFVGSVGLLMGPLTTISHLVLVKANAQAGLERILRVLATPSSLQQRPAAQRLRVGPLSPAHGIPCIEFRNVTFGYNAGEPILRDVSCRIEHGQTVALVGPSGSGKSTFARLVLRLYDAQKGQVVLNGSDVRDYDLQSLRGSFGVVTQDVFLFQTTLRENIRMVCPTATEVQLQSALDKAYVTQFLPQLPKGLDSPVGENGFGLSGGQRQRVAIARALLDDPPFFVFDEATSALDNQSEHMIQQAMNELRRGKTMLVIAHRLSTIRTADRILVFDAGRIVQEGTYEKLASVPGLFAQLLRFQAPGGDGETRLAA